MISDIFVGPLAPLPEVRLSADYRNSFDYNLYYSYDSYLLLMTMYFYTCYRTYSCLLFT